MTIPIDKFYQVEDIGSDSKWQFIVSQVVYQVAINLSPEEVQLKLDKAYNILFTEAWKALNGDKSI